jgi:hypothetical protein
MGMIVACMRMTSTMVVGRMAGTVVVIVCHRTIARLNSKMGYYIHI